jgi:ATP-dependent DNA helicase RecG
LLTHKSIKNGVGRAISGIKSENTMKSVFYRLRDRGYIELIKGYNYWIKTPEFDELANSEFPKLFIKE